jgi:pyridoxamine 5'-phosphate oxidase
MDDLRSHDPIALFRGWLEEATAAETNDPTAMCLATVNAAGRPSARMVLLKGVDPRGFVFYTNFESRKGREIIADPRGALCFHWKSLRRQVRVEGPIESVTGEEADAYFVTRARISRLGAWASLQSQTLDRKETLEARLAEVEARFSGAEVPRPPNWSGFRVMPESIEFWMDGAFRLHDRVVFHRIEDGWKTELLYP